MPRGVGGAGTSATRRGRCATGARRWKGRHGRRRRGGRATAAGEGEREPWPPERESASRGCRDLLPERESPSRRRRDLPRGGERETERERERKRTGEMERRRAAAGCLEEIRFGSFLFCPFTFFKIIDGRGGVCMGWALLVGHSSKFRSTSPLFLPLFKII